LVENDIGGGAVAGVTVGVFDQPGVVASRIGSCGMTIGALPL
jgi:hypothetical protein